MDDPVQVPEPEWAFLEDDNGYTEEDFGHLSKAFRSQYFKMLVETWHALLRHPWPEGTKASEGVVEYKNLVHVVEEARERMARLRAAQDEGDEEEKEAMTQIALCTQSVLGDLEIDLTNDEGTTIRRWSTRRPSPSK